MPEYYNNIVKHTAYGFECGYYMTPPKKPINVLCVDKGIAIFDVQNNNAHYFQCEYCKTLAQN